MTWIAPSTLHQNVLNPPRGVDATAVGVVTTSGLAVPIINSSSPRLLMSVTYPHSSWAPPA